MIEKGASLIGTVKYSMEKRQSDGRDKPEFLDCSAFLAWAFHKAGVTSVPYGSTTATFIGDKKWFPWEHEQYLEARKCGAFNPKEQKEKQEKTMEECEFLGEESLNYLKLQKDKNENIRLYELDAFSFMMMDLDEMEKKIHSTPNDKKGKAGEPTITASMIQSALHAEKEREEAERKAWFVENFDSLTILDIYASEWIGEMRRNVIRDLLQAEAPEEVIKSIIRPEIEEGQMLQKKKMWMEMEGK